MTVTAVRDGDRGAVVGFAQRPPCGPDEFCVDVNAGDVTFRPNHVRQQRRVVAGAGADLEHPITRPRRKQLKHLGHQRGLRRG